MKLSLLLILFYFLAVNCLGFATMGIDKHRARRHAYRIPEATLFLFAFIGGSIGSTIGMYSFHHKTRHWYFVVGMPLIIVLQGLLMYGLTKVVDFKFM